jgi:hypothetical protein
MDLLALHNDPTTITARTAEIRQTLLRDSRLLRQPNFQSIASDDLALLFKLYDTRFFNGWLANAITSTTGANLTFRLSRTMTSSGGKTIRKNRPLRNGTMGKSYEIAIASRMLFLNFNENSRAVTVCGLECTDRLSALQRIVEHEMLHLAEMLFWGKSSCSAPRFKAMAQNIFGHAASKHDLITPRESAAIDHALKIGAPVEFDFNGKTLAGLINRIHQRATVLVESPDGVPYRNGKSYQKYYIPIPMLRPIQK